jgi:hypothetical protein
MTNHFKERAGEHVLGHDYGRVAADVLVPVLLNDSLGLGDGELGFNT